MSLSDWKIEDHVCLQCLGRVVSRKAQGEGRIYRCSNCGAHGLGGVRSLCACGSKIGTRNAGIRCVPNDKKTLEFPSEIVAKEVIT